MLKKWMKQMALMIVSIILMVSTSDGISLDCKYSMVKWDIGRMYTCTATVILDGDTKDVTSVTDNHMEGRNNSDVKAALIYNQNLKFAPRNIQKFFKHLEAFSLFNNSIEEVTRECLTGLEELRYFNCLYNNVEIIESDLFTTNQMIEWIDFGFNPIRHVGHNAFHNLRSLQTLNFTQTTCIDQCGVDSDSVEYLKTQLTIKCPPVFEMTEMKIMN